MSKKNKKKKRNSQSQTYTISSQKKQPVKHKIPKAKNFVTITEDDRKILKSIPNPFFVTDTLCYLGFVAGFIFLGLAYIVSRGTIVGTYYEIFGYIGVVLGIYELYIGRKQKKKFKTFIDNEKFQIFWKYNDQTWEEFANTYEKQNPGPGLISVSITVFLLIVVTLLLYLSLAPDSRLIAVPFGIVSVVVVCFTSYFLPRFQLNRTRLEPYIVILNDNECYALGQYLDWNECEAKLVKNKGNAGSEIITLKLDIKQKDLLGKKEFQLPILLPNNNDQTVIEARNEAKRINNLTKEYNDDPNNKGDFLDKFFRKVVGRK